MQAQRRQRCSQLPSQRLGGRRFIRSRSGGRTGRSRCIGRLTHGDSFLWLQGLPHPKHTAWAENLSTLATRFSGLSLRCRDTARVLSDNGCYFLKSVCVVCHIQLDAAPFSIERVRQLNIARRRLRSHGLPSLYGLPRKSRFPISTPLWRKMLYAVVT